MTHIVNHEDYRAVALSRRVDLPMYRLVGLDLSILENPSPAAPIPRLRQAADAYAEAVNSDSYGPDILQGLHRAHHDVQREMNRAIILFDRSLLRVKERGQQAVKAFGVTSTELETFLSSSDSPLASLVLVRPKLPREIGNQFIPVGAPDFPDGMPASVASEYSHVRVGLTTPQTADIVSRQSNGNYHVQPVYG